MSLRTKILLEIGQQISELQNQPSANTVQRELTDIVLRLVDVVKELESALTEKMEVPNPAVAASFDLVGVEERVPVTTPIDRSLRAVHLPVRPKSRVSARAPT